ncbi:MAG: hypothetical protein IPK80_30220 [Nannocystis sp.]|nr:hypothetical protein [Nannocystis sp.]
MSTKEKTLARARPEDLARWILEALSYETRSLRAWQIPCILHCEDSLPGAACVKARPLTKIPFDTQELKDGCWTDSKGKETTKRLHASASQRLLGNLWCLGLDPLLFGFADPLASMVTLVLDATPKPDQDVNAAPKPDQGVFERILHHYFVEMRDYERMLAQRPSLQLILLTPPDRDTEKNRADFATLAQKLVRRLGEASFDIQLRRVIDRRGAQKDTLKSILAAHGSAILRPSFYEDPKAGGTPSHPLENAFTKALQWFPEPTTSGQSEQSGRWEDFKKLLASNPSRFGIDIDGKTEDTPKTPSSPSPSSLLLRLDFTIPPPPGRKIYLNLAPITLIASDNASGKTTTIEAISTLYFNRSRLRAILPNETQRGLASKAWRITEGVEPPAEGKPETPPQTLLPLFADDHELHNGTPGETALVSILPTLDRVERAALFKLLEQSDRYRAALSTIGKQGVMVPSSGSMGDTTRLMELVGIWRGAEPATSPQESSESGGGELRSAELEAGDIPLFFSWLVRADKLSEDNTWTALEALPSTPEFGKGLAKELAAVADAWRKRFEDRLKSSLEALERALPGSKTDADKLKESLCDYLDVAPELRSPEERRNRRQNTAQQVRAGFSLRLSRWIGSSSGELPILPILAIDEAVFGQDSAAAAAALGRFLRLHRIFSGLRWRTYIAPPPQGRGRLGSSSDSTRSRTRRAWASTVAT